MAGVVWARRELVDQQRPGARQEELDAEDAYDLQLFEHASGDPNSFGGDFGRDAGGRDGYVENAAAVGVLDRAVMGERSVGGAGGYDGELELEIDEGLEHGFAAADGLPGEPGAGAGTEQGLTATV